MGKRQDITLVAVSRDFDPAADAKYRLDHAGEDDVAYDQAMADLMTQPATTMRGVRGKLFALQSFLVVAEQGDEVSPEGWGLVRELGDQIDWAMARLADAERVPA